MQSFQELDTMLKQVFYDFHTKIDKEELLPQYLSSKNILLDLDKTDEMSIDFQMFDKLQEKLHLSMLEINIIFILFAPEINAKYERVYAYLQDNLNRTYPTVQLLVSLLCKNTEETQSLFIYFSKPSKLTLLHLLEFVSDDFNTLLFQQPLRLSPSVRNYLLGDVYIRGTLPSFCQIVSPNDTKRQSVSVEQYIRLGIQNSERYVINIYGVSKKRNKEEALNIASSFGFGLLCVDTFEALREETAIHKQMPLLVRDALLSGTLLYFESFDTYLTQKEKQEVKLFSALEDLAWLTFFSTKTIWSPKEIPKAQHFYALSKQQIETVKLQAYWQSSIARLDTTLAAQMAPVLANIFHFTEDEIDNISLLLHTQMHLGQSIDKRLILELCRSRISNNLSRYAEHISSNNSMADIVIPTKKKEQLQEIVIHYNYQNKVFKEWGYEKFFQSRGISLLFSGSSGTGKTMAASILANILGLELYKIDLSQMISKYVGETQKQLSSLFDAAQESGVILFFDEADAVFGKRTEVKDAHDRYANIEVSYLLQKIEAYDGIVVLASNFKENIDEAFLRRLRFVIDFPIPNMIQRERIWHKLLHHNLLDKPIDFRPLAKAFKLSGANIRNIALYAAFNAAGEERKIAMVHIVKALRSELEKTGGLFNESDFEGLLNANTKD